VVRSTEGAESMVEGEPTQSVNNEAKYLKKNQSFGEVADKFVWNEFGHLSKCESGTKY